MNFSYVFSKMIMLFLIMVVGYIACKAKVFDKDMRAKVSSLLLNVAIPGTILSSVLNQDNLPGQAQIIGLVLLAFSSYIIMFGAAYIFPKILGVAKCQEGIYRFMFAFGNVGFIGYPVTQAIFGNSAVFYTSIFNLPFNFFAYSVGVAFIAKSSGVKTEKSFSMIKTLLSPCMVASILSIILAMAHIQGPKVIGGACDLLGQITTPAALLIIGSSLAELPAKDMFTNARVYLFTVLKLIVVPLITYFIYKKFVDNQLLLGVAVVIAAMPVATNGTMMCLQYKGDEKLMAQGTFITTLLSMVSIPVISMLFM